MAEEEGILPAALEAQPDIPEHLSFFWDAFWALNGDRPLGFGLPGPILWASIDRFADRAGVLDGDQFGRLVRFIRVMDGEWRTYMAEQMKKKD